MFLKEVNKMRKGTAGQEDIVKAGNVMILIKKDAIGKR